MRLLYALLSLLIIIATQPLCSGFENLDLESFSGAPGDQEPTGWFAATRDLNRTDAITEVRPGSPGSMSFKMDFVREGFNQAEYYQLGNVTPGSQITMTAWIMSLAGSWYGQGRIAIFDGATTTWVEDGAGWYQGDWQYNNGAWTEVSVGPMTASGNSITIWIKGEGHWGEARFDDVELEISGGSTPTPPGTPGSPTPTSAVSLTPTPPGIPTNTPLPVTGFLRNPSFELGFTNNIANGWSPFRSTFYENAQYLIGDDDASDGSYSQKVLMPVVPLQMPDRKFGVYQRIRVVPGRNYTASMDFRTYLPGESFPGNDLVCVIGIDPYGDIEPNPHGTHWSQLAGSSGWGTLQVTGQAINEYVTVFCLAMRKWPQLGDGYAWIDNVSVVGPPPPTFTPTVTGTLPTLTPTATPTVTPPAVVGPELLINGDFEGNFTAGVADGWQAWQTLGGPESFWERSTLAGPIGAGHYFGSSNWAEEMIAMTPKTVLFAFGFDKVDDVCANPEFGDTIVVGRIFIDPYVYEWMYDPNLTDEQVIANARDIFVDGNGPIMGVRQYADLYPRIDCWCGLNEPDVLSEHGIHRATLWEKAVTERLHELGLKSCVLHLGVGNPGNPYNILHPEMQELLEIADYVGYHAYGGPNDQLMVMRYLEGTNLDDPYDFALRWRTYADWYAGRGCRMPPMIYSEGTTYGGWQGVIGQNEIEDDLTLFIPFINADPWALGMCIFCDGCTIEWAGWNIANTGIGAAVGPSNRADPVDKIDGLYSQQFGKGKVHPLTAYPHNGLFNGGIVQQVSGLTSGAYYRLEYYAKYDFRGMQPLLSLHHGIDHTGQTSDGNAATIDWSEDFVAAGQPTETHEVFYRREEIFQAESNTVSVWLRASHPSEATSFQVTVDAVSLKMVDPNWIPPDVTATPEPTDTPVPPNTPTATETAAPTAHPGRPPSMMFR
jgi:hypothetical protein